MIRFLIGSSLKLRFLVVAIAAAMIVFGIMQIQNMPVDVFPEFAPPYVEIRCSALGLSTIETEELITVNLEQWMTGTAEVQSVRSTTVPGLSSLILTFKPGTDMMLARQFIQERLTLVGLPGVATLPEMVDPLSSISRTMQIGLSSKDLSLIEMSMIAYWKIRPRLMNEPGVANVTIWGQRDQMLLVQVDPERLRDFGVSLDQVITTTGEAFWGTPLGYLKASLVGPGGWIETPDQRLGIHNVLPISTPDDLAQVPFPFKVNGTTLRLGDVAEVLEGHQPLIGDAVVNDGPGLILVVEKFPWANTLEVTRGVEEALDALRPGLAGITIDHEIFRPATFIEMSIDNLTNAMIIGAVLVILILFAFLFEWRVALISLVAIPLSLLAAVLVLDFRGVTINTMILAGLVIALGAVVDDAIIDIENIVRRLRQHRKEGGDKSITSTAKVIFEASLEVRSAIVFATLIIVLAVMPVFFMGGLAGSFFQPLAVSYALALLASMVIALTVTPALSLILLRNVPLERRESPLVRLLQRGYDAVLSRIVKTPRNVYLSFGVLVLAGLFVIPQLGQSLLPSFKERDFLMHWLTKPGTSHPEMYRITVQVSKELRKLPGVRNFGAHIGQAFSADEVVGIYFTENWISIDPKVDYDATLASIQEVVEGYPGIYRDVQTYLKERIREVLTGGSEAIIVRIYGPELDVLRSKAEEVEQVLSEIDGIVDLHVELQTEVPHVQVKVDLDAAGRYGIKPGDVRRMAAVWIASVEVGDIYLDQKRYDVALWSIQESRNSLTALQELMLDLPGGGHVRLEEVADIRIMPTPNEIRHEGFFRYIDVGANVSGRDLGSVATDVESRLKEVEFPLQYYPKLMGEYAERQSAQKRMLGFAVIALIGIFLLLQASFQSWRLASLSFFTLPMALAGGVLAAFAGGGIISLGSLVGFFAVLGIAARNGIMLINHYQHLERHEGETFGTGLVLRGARERLVPILMTATTTGFALLPLVIAGNIPGNEIELPMAIVIVGGLVTSTLLNLLIIPPLYLRFGAKQV